MLKQIFPAGSAGLLSLLSLLCGSAKCLVRPFQLFPSLLELLLELLLDLLSLLQLLLSLLLVLLVDLGELEPLSRELCVKLLLLKLLKLLELLEILQCLLLLCVCCCQLLFGLGELRGELLLLLLLQLELLGELCSELAFLSFQIRQNETL